MITLKVEVKMKPGHFDPEGNVTAKSLKDLGFKVGGVRVSKVYTIEVETVREGEAVELGKEMCRKLLANPTKDNFIVEVIHEDAGLTAKGK